MRTVTASDFPAQGYALHVDVALGPQGPIEDAVFEVEDGRVKALIAGVGIRGRIRARRPRNGLPGWR